MGDHWIKPLPVQPLQRQVADEQGESGADPKHVEDILGERHYADLTDQEPGEDERVGPYLPDDGPDETTIWRPERRVKTKSRVNLGP